MPRATFHRAFADLPREALGDGWLERAGVRTDGSLVVFNWLEPGFDAPPPHDHPFDQLALILSGVLEFQLDGQRYVVSSGEFLYIPAGEPHTARVLGHERVLNVDVFAPARPDYAHLAEAQPG